MKLSTVLMALAAVMLMALPASAARKKAPRHPPQPEHIACTRGGRC